MSVYVARVGRYLKIGFSENPERRVRNLWKSGTRYGRPWDLSVTEVPELLMVVEDADKSDERAHHRALADWAVGCEWFVDEPAVREFMQAMVNRGAHYSAPRVERLERDGGPFVPVPFEDMLPERADEIDRMVANRRRAS